MPAIRYIGKFASADGNVYQVRLHDSEFSGSATGFPLQSVVYVRGRRGADIFTPIRASSVELVGYKLSSSALDELLGAEVGRFTMEIWRGSSHATLDSGGGEFYWKGIVQTDLGEDDTASEISNISITAIDGLSQLRDVLYLDTTGEEPAPYIGRQTHFDTIRECLEKIGYSLPVSFSGEWRSEEGVSGDILWEHAEVDQAVFYNDDGAPATCYEVLKQLLYGYGGVMFWREGRFLIIQKSQIGAGTYTANDYDDTGEGDGESDFGTTADADSAVRLSGQRTYKTALGGLTVVYHHGNIPSLVEDFDGEGDWTFGASGGEIRKSGGRRLVPPRDIGRNNPGRIERINVAFVPAFFFGSDTSFTAFRDAIKASDRFATHTGEEVQAGDIIALTGRFRIPYNAGDGDGLYHPFFELQIGSNADAYLGRDGVWFTPSGSDDLQPLRIPGEDYNEYGFALSRDPSEGWYDFTIISSPAPYTGDVRLVLYGTGDENGSNLDPEGVEWADVAVLIVDETGELRDAKAFSGATTSPEPVDEDLVVLIGEGPHPAVAGAITWDGEDSGEWTDGVAGPENVTQLLVRTRLGYQSQRLELRFEKYNSLNYEMGDPVQIDSNLYDVVFHEKDLASQDDTIEAVRIRYDDADITFAEVSQDLGSYVPGGGGSTSVISSSDTDTLSGIIREKGDLIIGDGEGNPVQFDSGEDDGKVLVTDGEADNGWSLQDLTPITSKGDLIVADGAGAPVRLPAPPDGYFWIADSTKTLGWKAINLSGIGISSEITEDYLPASNVHRFTLNAKGTKLPGSGYHDTTTWVITEENLPDNMIDSDHVDSEASGAPTLRVALDEGGLQQIGLHVVDFSPASGGVSGGATAKIYVDPGVFEGGEDLPVTFFWITGGSQTQPAASADYGQYSAYRDEFAYYYHCEDDPSDGWVDATRNARHSSSVGSMTLSDRVAGQVGNGTELDGTDDGMEVSSPGFPEAGNDFVLGRWVKANSKTGYPALGGIRQSDSGVLMGCFFDIEGSSDKFRFVVRNSAGTDEAAAISSTLRSGALQHVVGRFDDSEFKTAIFIDGALEDEETTTGTRFTQTGIEYIGCGWFDSALVDFLDGTMDEPWRYDGWLSNESIEAVTENQKDPGDFWDSTASVEDGPFI